MQDVEEVSDVGDTLISDLGKFPPLPVAVALPVLRPPVINQEKTVVQEEPKNRGKTKVDEGVTV